MYFLNHFTGFPSTKVHMQTQFTTERASLYIHSSQGDCEPPRRNQFTCFSSTKVQMLTQFTTESQSVMVVEEIVNPLAEINLLAFLVPKHRC